MSWRRIGIVIALALVFGGSTLFAADPAPEAPAGPKMMSLGQLFEAGGTIGYIITGLSFLMVALIVEHLISLRHNALIPPGLADSIHHHLALRHFEEARQQCQFHPSFLAYVLAAGLRETDLGYSAVEKSLEDAAVEQSARLYRKIEYLSVIGTIAPMLGLLGTVWGMILAFMEFEQKANPQVSELAPGIYKALVTTLQGLCVAIPALAAFAHFRNRIDQLVADGALTAEAVFADYKRSAVAEPRSERVKAATSLRGKPATEMQLENPGTAAVASQAKLVAKSDRPAADRGGAK
ncbi:MAG: MotA/TolQ/ExbB proton channel family protein [Planctomycetota bacterium]|nr:MAG: MotA/TolQ/ExbB proton channel family protein [Planctomycetota bacterium]GDY08605.1 TolQ-type transporter [Planctomycetia bacterium]